MEKDRDAVACCLVDLGIVSNSDLYVIQNLDSKSDINPCGQPPPVDGSSYAREDEKLLDIESGGVSGTSGSRGDGGIRSLKSVSRVVADGGVGASLSVFFGGLVSLSLYCRPRHHTGWSCAVSLVGSGSQNI